VKKVAGVSQQLADFGFQKARKPKPPASKSAKAKGKEKENSKDPAEALDEMLLKLSKLKVLKGPPSRHILGPDGLPISSMSMFKFCTPLCFLPVFDVASKQKQAVTRPQSILDAVPTKAFSLPSFKPASGRVFKPIIDVALRPTSNDVLKPVGNGVRQLGNKDINAFGGATPASKALAAALDDLDTNMGDATPTQPPVLECNPSSPSSALPTTTLPVLSIGRLLFIAYSTRRVTNLARHRR